MKSVHYNSRQRDNRQMLFFFSFIHCYTVHESHTVFSIESCLFICLNRITYGLVDTHTSTCKLKKKNRKLCKCVYLGQGFLLHWNLKLSLCKRNFCNDFSHMLFGTFAFERNKSISYFVCFFHGSSWHYVEYTHINPDHVCHIKRFVQRWWMCTTE